MGCGERGASASAEASSQRTLTVPQFTDDLDLENRRFSSQFLLRLSRELVRYQVDKRAVRSWRRPTDYSQAQGSEPPAFREPTPAYGAGREVLSRNAARFASKTASGPMQFPLRRFRCINLQE